MAAALFRLPCANEKLHGFEDFVCPAHMPVDEMSVMNLKEPMIFLVFLSGPMPSVQVFVFLGSSFAFFCSLCGDLFSQLVISLT